MLGDSSISALFVMRATSIALVIIKEDSKYVDADIVMSMSW
jgi:hypothetical protein